MRKCKKFNRAWSRPHYWQRHIELTGAIGSSVSWPEGLYYSSVTSQKDPRVRVFPFDKHIEGNYLFLNNLAKDFTCMLTEVTY